MNDKQLLQKAIELQKEGKRVVESLGLLEILQQISNPKLEGSVITGLMVWPDIDIHAEMDKVDIHKVVGVMEKLVLLSTIQRVQFNNYRELRRDHRKNNMRFPHGYYLGLRSVQPSGEWKIDMWFAEKGELLNDYDLPESSTITQEQRVTVLNLKTVWLQEDGGYKDDVVSVDFYRAVFDDGIRTPEEFREWLKSERKF
jgi:hypothetical protein